MADEPSLPRIPTISYDAHSGTFANSRKRARRDNPPPLFSNSSDPAFFSSDDDASAENYTQGRRKKRYVGSWFQQHLASSDSPFADEPMRTLPVVKSKRTLERQFDSGVWMGSDGTEVDDDGMEELELPVLSRLPGMKQVTAQLPPPPPPPKVNVVSPAERSARDLIQRCIDDGDENVDLSALELEDLSNVTVSSLSEFSCIPIVTKGVPFEPRDPRLRLYLYRNRLTKVPGAVFDLQFLSVLSLRGNRLTELPPAIGKLRRLQSLNVSQNSLRYLPPELLDLICTSETLTDLHLHPNPFFQPLEMPDLLPSSEREVVDPKAEDKISIRKGVWLKKRDADLANGHIWPRNGHSARLLARSLVQYTDGTGSVCSSFRLPTYTDSLRSKKVQTEGIASDPALPSSDSSHRRVPLAAMVRQSSRVPTLLELSLRTCYRTNQLEQLTSLLPENCPPHLYRLLSRTLEVREAGGMSCTVCRQQPMIVPRAEWVEWWEVARLNTAAKGFEAPTLQLDPISTNEKEWAVPFIRQSCSWKCLPSRTAGETHWDDRLSSSS